MLNPENITYGVYIKMQCQQKDDLDFLIRYGNYEKKDYLSETPLQDRSFEVVKELQQNIIDNDTELFFENLMNIKEYKIENIINRKCYEVIMTFNYCLEEIVKLLEIESKMLVTSVPQKDDYSMFFEQVDFSVFPAYYTQLRSLANNDITKFDTIKKMKYSDCFVELCYRQKEADVQTLISNSISSKK